MSEINNPCETISCSKDCRNSFRYPIGVDEVVNFVHCGHKYNFKISDRPTPFVNFVNQFPNQTGEGCLYMNGYFPAQQVLGFICKIKNLFLYLYHVKFNIKNNLYEYKCRINF